MEGLVSSDFHPPHAFVLPARPDPASITRAGRHATTWQCERPEHGPISHQAGRRAGGQVLRAGAGGLPRQLTTRFGVKRITGPWPKSRMA